MIQLSANFADAQEMLWLPVSESSSTKAEQDKITIPIVTTSFSDGKGLIAQLAANANVIKGTFKEDCKSTPGPHSLANDKCPLGMLMDKVCDRACAHYDDSGKSIACTDDGKYSGFAGDCLPVDVMAGSENLFPCDFDQVGGHSVSVNC